MMFSSLVLLLFVAVTSKAEDVQTPPSECQDIKFSGYYPAKDSTKYVWCDGKNRVGAYVICPSGYEWNLRFGDCMPTVYDKVTKSCKPKLKGLETERQGTWDCTKDENIGSVCSLACNEGYYGNDDLKCEQSNENAASMWNKRIPVCTSKCIPNPCINGLCSLDGAKFKCECEPGWTDDICATEENNCGGMNCRSPKYCVNGNPATCACPQGFTGEDCNVKID